MLLSNKTCSVLLLVLSGLWIFFMFLMLLVIPILPLDEGNILLSFSPVPILLFSGIFGLVFIGGLSIFTIYVMGKGKWTQLFKNKNHCH